MSRRSLTALTWVACTGAAILVAWLAVSTVVSGTAEEVVTLRPAATTVPSTTAPATTTAPSSDVASAASSDVSSSSAPPHGDPEASSSPSATGGDHEGEEHVASSNGGGSFAVTGGVVTVRCDGDAISLVSASPQQGYTVEVSDSGPDQVEVHFRSGEREGEIKLSCSAGNAVISSHD